MKMGTLVAVPWTLGVIILFIAAHNPDPFGIDITLAAIATMGLAYSAIAVNLLIAFADRTQSLESPAGF